MSLSQIVVDTLTKADAKALATDGPTGLNVVPVSMIKINPDSIWLFDFFMEKTVQNLQTKKEVALTAWTDMVGVQLKAQAEYVTTGNDFVEAVEWVKSQNPERVVKGLLLLTPTELYDISPGGVFAPEDLAL